MNDNIRKIWNKAASSHQQEDTSWKTQQNFLTRFAKLVAEECANIADKAEPYQSSELIRKHFTG
jgi:hypothetical protein